MLRGVPAPPTVRAVVSMDANHSARNEGRRFSPAERVVGRRDDGDPVIRLEIYGIVILAFAVALLLALFTFDPVDVTPTGGTRTRPAVNAIGPIGAHVADLFLGVVGLGAFAVAGTFALLGLTYLIGRRSSLTRLDVLGWVGVLVSACILAHVALAPARFFGHLPGGAMGAYAGEVTRAFLSTPGTLLAAVTLLVVSIIAITRRSIFELGLLLGAGLRRAWAWGRAVMKHGDADEAAEREALADDGPIIKTPQVPAAVAAQAGEAVAPRTRAATQPNPPRGAGVTDKPAVAPPRPPPAAAQAPDAEPSDADEDDDGPTIHAPRRQVAPAGAVDEAGAEDEEDSAADELDDEDILEARVDLDDDEDDEAPVPRRVVEDEDDEDEGVVLEDEGRGDADGEAHLDNIKIVESAAMRRSRDLTVGEQIPLRPASAEASEDKPFELPSLTLLDYKPPEGTCYDRELLKRNAQLLEAKLADYRVKGKVVEIHPGPVITMYEFLPAAGVKISSIANLADDLAMALSALRIRIVAPIPGKNVVGIEVPNSAREIVWLKEILGDPVASKSKSKLTLALGKDIVGNPTVMDLAKAPHLLVAGSTGSGKSVAINSFIVSLLYNATPDDVRCIFVDPKMLELSIYEGIPHLLLPVVTDPKQAAVALRWAVKEMERRYKLMADLGVRNLANYNAKVTLLTENPDQRLPEKLRMAKSMREAKGFPDPKGVILDCDGKELEKLPLIVVIIDELADLMMVASKDVEMSIARLAQMARASGIHLILATQRPSVDVITGLIKANFPTRISFQVASKIDSRTILDQKGAEALLGMGDMLYLPPGSAAVKRVHGCYVSEDEVHAIVAHLKEQGRPDYDLGILATDDEEDAGPGAEGGDEYDEFYDQAVRIVAETRNASISFLQRKLKIGYNRSARIVEKMEREGIVGPSDGTSRPREVFIDPI